MDINRKKITKNAYRITKKRGYTASRVRVPGGHLDASLLVKIQEIAEKYGNGTVHITTRQGFEIPEIPFDKMDEVNELLQPIIETLGINQVEEGTGYSAAGTRNVSACAGNNICPFANSNTSDLAKEIEDNIFPNDLHFKIAITGCPNDCIKARMHDFGIISMTKPVYDKDRCVSCGACEKACRTKSTEALDMVNYKIKRDERKCIGCGICVNSCPTGAWTRDSKKYYRLAIMGRTGKKNPRLAEDWIIWADKETIIKIIMNTYEYVEEYIDRSLPKEHIGYIVDRTGFMEYKKWALKDTDIPEEAIVKDNVYWSGIHYNSNRSN